MNPRGRWTAVVVWTATCIALIGKSGGFLFATSPRMFKITPTLFSQNANHIENEEEHEAAIIANTTALPLRIHHSALKTRNITTSIQFYSLLGFEVEQKFRAGPARAAWLRLCSCPSLLSARLELIEVPDFMLQEAPGTRKRAIDLGQRQDLLGWNHLALDVTDVIRQQQDDADEPASLLTFLQRLNTTSVETFGKTLRVALYPKQQMMGNQVYELAFLYDADGCLVELLHKLTELEQSVDSGWEPLNETEVLVG